MEFPFDINHLFPERFSILDQTLVAGRKTAGMPHLQANIETVIDELGRASAKAQQLPASITSASKLQSQKHQLYLLKEGESKGGRGVVVGFLKVGYKKLFLLDRQGSHVEAEPLCILDFYIAENLQRYGYGRELFDFMLQHKKLEPVLMAYDRPSPKFLSFLAKHYCLTPSVPQANNFVVFEGFFVNIAVAQLRKVPLRKPDGEIKPYSLVEREAVHQEQRARPWPFAPPHSPQRSVSSQCSPPLSGGSSPSRPRPQAAPVPALGRSREQSPQSPPPRALQGKTQQRAGWGGHLQPLQGAPEQRSSWTAAQTFPRSKPLSLPPLFASKKPHASSVYRGTQLGGAEEELRGLDSLQRAPRGMLVNQQRRLLERESPGGRGGWWCTAGESCRSAQWVKQEHRSTRPW
ncbi:hypothetical protein CesoFtcFv8_019384 [Champsocephalus esox]|uniref:Alpha-tubulin N-acetyltransferase 1 n=1 Tax=Champsocephalus esox TaxID=159716 RepID=A0AAN8BDU2_9TELE|nr:hypothetical protein CesoFtcFv8_019384 [Champsocephalus esox]